MNAVIYARYSSDSQREESIEGQLRECKEYAEKNGITIVTRLHGRHSVCVTQIMETCIRQANIPHDLL